MAFLLALVEADEGVDTMDAMAENAAKCLCLWEICEGGGLANVPLQRGPQVGGFVSVNVSVSP